MHIILLPLVWTHLISASSFTLKPQVRHTLCIQSKCTSSQCYKSSSVLYWRVSWNLVRAFWKRFLRFCSKNAFNLFLSVTIVLLMTYEKKSLLQNQMRSVMQRRKRSDLGNSNPSLHSIFNHSNVLIEPSQNFLIFCCEDNLIGQNNKSEHWCFCLLVINHSSET